MAYEDPARAKKRTKQEIIKAAQDACKQTPCNKVLAGRINCPFCPWYNKLEVFK